MKLDPIASLVDTQPLFEALASIKTTYTYKPVRKFLIWKVKDSIRQARESLDFIEKEIKVAEEAYRELDAEAARPKKTAKRLQTP